MALSDRLKSIEGKQGHNANHVRTLQLWSTFQRILLEHEGHSAHGC